MMRAKRSTFKFKGGLEEANAAFLRSRGIAFKYEAVKLHYTVPARPATYRPDFLLPNGIIVETKGLFETADRHKMLLIKQQFPDIDIRMVFSSSKKKIYKGSPTSYGAWCDKHGFKYADKLIPEEWLKEPAKPLPAGIEMKE